MIALPPHLIKYLAETSDKLGPIKKINSEIFKKLFKKAFALPVRDSGSFHNESITSSSH